MKGTAVFTAAVICLCTLTGLGALYLSVAAFPHFMGWQQAGVMLMAVVLQLLNVDLFTYFHKEPAAQPSERRRMTAGLAGTFLVLGLYGTEVAVITALLQSLVILFVHRMPWYKHLFNTGLAITATFLAGFAYARLGGMAGAWTELAVAASLLATGLYFLVQSTGVAMVISLSTGRPFRPVWLDSFGWVMLQQAVFGMVGMLLGRFQQMGMTIMGGVLLLSPLVLLRYSYRSFATRTRAYVDQIEAANADLARLNEELRTTNDELIHTLSSVLDARDRYTYGHSASVAMYSVALGQKLNLTGPELEELRVAALLHDIGKVGIPESILFKAGPLNEEERRIMQAHAEIGYRITRQIHSLSAVAAIIRQHHEWIGGGGYPLNLKGDEILLSARIVGVADALDTLISDRPYRKGKPVEVAFQEIRRCTGTQFDPLVVGALEALLREKGGVWFQNSAYRVTQSALALEVAASMSG